MSRRKRYTFPVFVLDCFMTVITGGLWLIVCGVRYAINNR